MCAVVYVCCAPAGAGTRPQPSPPTEPTPLAQAEALWADREKEESLRKAIALYEEEFRRRPSVALSTRLARAYGLLADVFLEGKDRERLAIHEKGIACARERVEMQQTFRDAVRRGESVADAVARVDKDHLGPLYWWAAHFARWIADQPLLAKIRHQSLLLALLGRVQALDETYFYGGCHRLWGAYYTQRGRYDRAAASFERAAQIAPAFLVTRRMYAVLYATPRRDRKLFVEQLTLAARQPKPEDADILPEFRLERELALKLLAQTDQLFPK